MYSEPCYGRVDLCEDIFASMGVLWLRVDDICAMEPWSNNHCIYPYGFHDCILLFWRDFLGTGGMVRAEEQLRLDGD